MSFADLGLSDDLLRAIGDSGYTEPTPIQAGAIPPVLMGKDLIGIAQTGTGKTAAFVLPMIDILARAEAALAWPRSLILEPTRELAAQVAENFEKYGQEPQALHALLIGGGADGRSGQGAGRRASMFSSPRPAASWTCSARQDPADRLRPAG
jgi:superfamily II DNA/RNA helicase